MNNKFKLSVFIKTLRDDLTNKLQEKTGWGRVEVMEVFNNSINEILINLIAENVVVDGADDNFSWVYEEEVESRTDKVKRLSDSMKQKLNNKVAERDRGKELIDNAVTSKQMWAIGKIEDDLRELEIKFEGSDKFDAIEFISKYKGKTVEDILPKGVL